MKPSICIDDTLPNHENLEEYFKNKGFEIVEKEKANVCLMYAHNTASRMNMSRYEDFNKSHTKTKTVFFLWYSWATHYSKQLSSYFHPGDKSKNIEPKLDMFDEAKCRHIQLPASNEQIENTVNDLLKFPVR